MFSFFSSAKRALARRLGRDGGAKVRIAATGSGRTSGQVDHSGCTSDVIGVDPDDRLREMVRCAARAIDGGSAVVVFDASGERAIRPTLARAAGRSGLALAAFSARDPLGYRIPWGRLSGRAIAAIVLCGRYQEPYYRRTCERHILELVRVLRLLDIEPNLRELLRFADPSEMLKLADRLDDSDCSEYLHRLSASQREVIEGWRIYADAVLASSVGRVFDARTPDTDHLDLLRAITGKAVVYLNVEVRTSPHLTEVLREAIIQDLLSAASKLADSATPSLVLITDSSRIHTSTLMELLNRSRSAGINVLMRLQPLS
jgi:hypothetical protein